LTRAPGPRYRKPVASITPAVTALDLQQQATLEESLAFCRLAHQRAHEATAALTEALNSGQVSITETARRRLVDTVKAATEALAQL